MAGGVHLNNTQTKKCTSLPPYVNSNGWLQDENALTASLPVLELHMFAIFLISHGCHFILKRYGIHILVSQILAGVIVGTTGLGHQSDYTKIFLTIDSKQILGTLAGLGYQLFGFINGIKMDLALVRKTGKMAIYSGILSMVIPGVLGGVTERMVSKYWNLERLDKLSLILVMLVQSMTPFPVICSFIGDLKLTNSELGRLGLSSVLTSEMLTQVFALVAFFIGIAYKQRAQAAIKSVIISVAFLVIVLYVVRPAMFWVIKQTPKGRPVKDVYTDIIIFGALASGALFHYIGLNVFLGSLVFGLAVPAGPPLASAVVEKIECVVTGVLVPLFMAMCTMEADLLKIDFNDYILKSTAIVVFVVILAKFGAYLVPLLYFKLPKQDALALAFLTSTKGIVELGSFTYMKELGVCSSSPPPPPPPPSNFAIVFSFCFELDHGQILTEGMFAFLVITVLLSATISSIAVNWVYDPSRKYAGYQNRNIMHSKELRILTCIYRPYNTTSIINFIKSLCPTIQSPFSVSVLHLIKISGRASPMYISHQMQKKTVSLHSISGNVILSFKHFQQNYGEAVSVNVFTAISPPKLMHEDICTLALDEIACFLVLPFHKKWLVDGSIESEDPTLRTLNCCVLERAPCSVGILIDRGNQVKSIFRDSSRGPSLLAAVIFFGGNDDREALVLAKRMSQNTNSNITIARFIPSTEEPEINRDSMLDSQALSYIMQDYIENETVDYIEERVGDGLETSKTIRSMLDKYDLFIVGRRKDIQTPQTAGLDDMNEYPELGVIGGLLASMDTAEKYSVLVVKQQVAL
ncbi:hypothetical protein OIU77_005866 [Salix suchowensis]|uniref:Cation/H+ exchanger domain-containing protein n=1 Tax=Salix suchowensis TaxID=1278906 RepID=A0ABQ9AS47_9ROSI|nr:hypothetical protein OIU77_005866 [Salix suchowensis]